MWQLGNQHQYHWSINFRSTFTRRHERKCGKWFRINCCKSCTTFIAEDTLMMTVDNLIPPVIRFPTPHVVACVIGLAMNATMFIWHQTSKLNWGHKHIHPSVSNIVLSQISIRAEVSWCGIIRRRNPCLTSLNFDWRQALCYFLCLMESKYSLTGDPSESR